MAEKREFTVGGGRRKSNSSKSDENKSKNAQPPKEQRAMKERSHSLTDVDETDDDEDEELLSEVQSRGINKNPIIFAVAGITLVLIIIIVFLLLSSRKTEPIVSDIASTSSTSTPIEQQPSVSSGNTNTTLDGLGTQDFTGNTNMTTSDTLTNPDSFVEDIYGLTVQVDYTVESINEVADFVSYTKHRGTWGGGLELYWLDAVYQGNKYVIQVPFRYYKELTDEGIIPVKMEVLTIKGSTPNQTLTVVSYMSLDEKVLQNILKQQS